jgi:hypothetical protein
MIGITLYQPWAFAIVAGYKGNETRGHYTNVRGRVFIHAAKKHPYKVPGFIPAAKVIGVTSIEDLALGAIVGTVEIVDCVPVESIAGDTTDQERALGDYSPGRYAWITKDPVMFETPIPAKGKQGWWRWLPEAAAEPDGHTTNNKEKSPCLR